jgi:hypothetical protein
MGKHLGRPRLPMSVIVRSKTSAACLDLIDRLLVWDPARSQSLLSEAAKMKLGIL